MATQFITDTVGKKLVVMPYKEYKHIMDNLEDLEDIKLYDKVKRSEEKSIPIDEAFKQIEAKRKKEKR
jgi:PHD/YefM family antitoxin component YafN of YafNO toxin-antitoxin module